MKYLRTIVIIILGLIGVIIAAVWIVPLPDQAETSIEELLKPGQVVTMVKSEPAITMTWGKPTDPSILLIHGFGGNSYSWKPLGEKLGSLGYFVIAMDLRGFGLSNKSWHDDYSHRAQAQWVSDIATSYGVTSAITISHSMGANIALHLHEMHPELTRKIIFLDGAFVDPAPSPWFVAWLLNWGTARRLSQQIYRRIASPTTVNKLLDSASSHPEKISQDIRESILQALQRKDWDLALLKMTIDRPQNNLNKLPPLMLTDILIIWGDKDTWIPSSVGEQFRTRIASEQNQPLDTVPPIDFVPDAGHVVFLDQTEIVLEKIENFLVNRPQIKE